MFQKLADGGTLFYLPEFLPSDEAAAIFQTLKNGVRWEKLTTAWGAALPRLTAYYADPGVFYDYSGVSHPPQDWTPELDAVRKKVEAVADATFNSVLLNFYRNGSDSMGYHADDERELGQNPIVPSVSLGAERRFLIKHNRTGQRITLYLEHGSLLVMGGTMQRHWKHALPKMRGDIAERINLTFRKIDAAASR